MDLLFISVVVIRLLISRSSSKAGIVGYGCDAGGSRVSCVSLARGREGRCTSE